MKIIGERLRSLRESVRLSQAKKAPQERSRFCKNRSTGLGDKFPQQAQSGSKPPCLPGVKPAGFAGWQAAKRALFALLASSFCAPSGGALKADPCPNKLLKISALSGKMAVYNNSHRQEVTKAHGAAAAMKKERVFGERGLTA